MSIVKGARGLPRFMADCGFWRHPKWMGTDLAQIGLFTACLSYCYEHETDGDLPGPDVDDFACALGLKVRHVKPALAALLVRGSLAATDSGFEIVDFASHNPTSSEIQEHREKRTAAAKKAAEARWSQPEPHANGNANRMRNGVRVRNARGEESRGEDKDSVELAFDAVWSDYPRKEARKDALKAYRARVNEGASFADLARAVSIFAPAMANRDRDKILLGSTFFGPGDRWKDYLQPIAVTGNVGGGDVPW